MFSRLPFAVLSVLFATISSAQNVSELTLTPAAKTATAVNLSQIVPPSFAGMGIEPTNLFSYLGFSEANVLSMQLLRNLADYSGVPPQLRIGGNAQDIIIYDSSVDDWGFVKNPHSIGQGATPSDINLFGDTYFKALDRLPTATPIVFGLNLAYNSADWASRIVTVAREALKQVTNPTIISFEIGNEPDLYLGNGFRPPTYDGVQYTKEWLARAEVITNQVLTPLNLSSRYFEPGTAASTIGKPFEIPDLINDGINKTANGTHNQSYIAGWNEHDYYYFVNVSDCCLTLEHLMDLNFTDQQFAYWAVQVGVALNTGYPYYLREMGSAGPIGLRGISDTFGASLWTLNFFLYAATLNISSVDFHMTDNSWAAPWQPIEKYGLQPYVRPSYYAFAAMAQIIGNGNGTTRVTKLDNEGNSNLRIYASYTHDSLQSVIMINANLVNASASHKDGVTFNLNLPDFKNQVLHLSTLTADGADSTSGTSWNGLQFSDDDGTSTGDSRSAANTVSIDGSGKASILVRDSQAIVANLGWVLGTNAVVQPNSTDPRFSTSSHKGDASKASATTAVIGGVTTTILSGATSLPANPSQKKGDASVLSGWSHDAIILALTASAVSLGAANLLWRCS